MSYVTGALLLSAAVSAGTAAYSSSQQKKAGKKAAQGQMAASGAQLDFYKSQASEREGLLKKLIKDGNFEFPSVDAGKAADDALATTTRNLPGVLTNTATAYDSAAANFTRYLKGAFGEDGEGKPAFQQMQTETNNVVLDQLKGRLSEGTRTLLGRRALGTGAVSLGSGAVQDAFTYGLGIASEDQVQKGIQNYGNLYETYGRFAPQISPLDLLQYGGLSTASSLQNAQFNAQGEFKGQLAEASAILGGVDQATATIGPSVGPAVMGSFAPSIAGYQGNAMMGEAIGQGVAGILGAFAGIGAVQNPNSIYGSSAQRTQLPAGEAAYNRANGISDFTASDYFLRGSGGSGGGRALATGAGFGGDGSSGTLQALRWLLSTAS